MVDPHRTSELFDRIAAATGWVPPTTDDHGVSTGSTGGGSVSYSQDSLATLAEHGGASWWNDHRARWVVAALRAAAITELVEVGAGAGSMTARLSRSGFEVVAVEPFHEGAARIATLGHTAFCGTLTDLALPDNSVPALGYFDVLEHLPTTLPELTEAHRILRPGGVLVVTVPSYPWMWSEEDVLAGHFRRYDRTTLRRDVEDAGFLTEQIEYLFASLVAPALLIRRLPYLLGRGGRRTSGLARQLDPPPPLAAVARTVLGVEYALSRRVRLPFGLSTAAVFRKPGT